MKKVGSFVALCAVVFTSVATFLGGGAAAITATPARAGAASSATPVSVNLNCAADAPIVGTQYVTQDLSLAVDAPATVLPGGTFTISSTPAGGEIPSSMSGVTVNDIKNFILKLPVPANSQVLHTSLGTNGSGNLGTPSIGVSGANIVITVPGPIPGGASYQFPTISIELKATGADYSTVRPRLGGTSYDDPGFTFTVDTSVGSVPTRCYPSSSPTLSTTQITPPDLAAPVITLTTPAEGATYPVGSQVLASYGCDDGVHGSGVASCAGPVPNGGLVDTSTVGDHQFTVTTTDNAGNTASASHGYTISATPVVDSTPPDVTITSPADGAVYRQAGPPVTAAFTCTDNPGGDGIASCSGSQGADPVSNGGPIDLSVGSHTLSVTGTDNAGNPTTIVRTYRVLAGAPTTIGPKNVTKTLSGGVVNTDGAVATYEVTAPAANGGDLVLGDTVTVEWSVYKAKLGLGNTSNWGPDDVKWVLAAPSNTVINGPVTIDENGLNGEKHGDAHEGPDPTGVTSVTPSANPTGAGSITAVFDDDSNPRPIPIDDGDGLLMHAKFTATVTHLGAVTVQGFPALSWTNDCGPFGWVCNSGTMTNGVDTASVGVAFNAIDTTPPAVSVTSPTQGEQVAPGSTLAFTYSCSDEAGGSGVSSCQGYDPNGLPVPNGGTVGVGGSGPYQVRVVGADTAGNTNQQIITYVATPPDLVATGCTYLKNGESCTYTVTLSNPSTRTVSVDYTAQADTLPPDALVPASGTLTFAPGETTKTFAVHTNAGSAIGTYEVVFSDAEQANLKTPNLVTIVGTPAASVQSASVVRPAVGTAPLPFRVNISPPSSTDTVIHFHTVDGTALARRDYQPVVNGSVTIAAGDTTGQLSVDVVGSQSDEPDLTFAVVIDDVDGVPAPAGTQANGTIEANGLLAGCQPGDSQNARFVCHLYWDALGRAAEPGGKRYWLQRLDGGDARTTMATAYLYTSEARRVLVNRIYDQYLRRDGDAAGIAYWADQLAAGRTPDDVRVLVLSSAEYFDNHGSTNVGFMTAMYTDVFRRAPDPAGVAYWTGVLDHGVSPAMVAAQFLHTPEGRQHVIDDVYLRFLRRHADPAGVSFWVQQLAAGATEISIYLQVISSQEYFAR